MSPKLHLAIISDGYLCGRPPDREPAGGRNVSPGSLGRHILEDDLKNYTLVAGGGQ